VAHLFGNQLCGFLVDDLVDGRHGAQLHHRFDDLRTFNRHLVSQIANGDGFADHNVTVNGLSRLLEALLQSRTFTLAAFTAANGRTGFFTVSFDSACLLPFSPDALLSHYDHGHDRLQLHGRYHLQPDVHAEKWSRDSRWCLQSAQQLHTILLIFFCHTARFFRYAASFFFQLTACFFFRFTLQLGSFIFTAGFFSLGGFGHFVGLLIAHFVFFRSVTLHFITCVAFRFFCGLTFSF
jgi:hypothetical protein